MLEVGWDVRGVEKERMNGREINGVEPRPVGPVRVGGSVVGVRLLQWWVGSRWEEPLVKVQGCAGSGEVREKNRQEAGKGWKRYGRDGMAVTLGAEYQPL